MEGKNTQTLPEVVIGVLIGTLGRKNLRTYLEYFIQSKIHYSLPK